MDQMAIWQAIGELLQMKNYCTIADIARITGKKQAHVLHEVNRNKDLLKIDRNKGRITGFQDIITRQRNEAFEAGKCYKLDKCYIDILDIRNPNFSHLFEKISYGAYTDVYNVSVIKDTPENRKALEDGGLVEWKHYPTHRLNVLWIMT